MSNTYRNVLCYVPTRGRNLLPNLLMYLLFTFSKPLISLFTERIIDNYYQISDFYISDVIILIVAPIRMCVVTVEQNVILFSFSIVIVKRKMFLKMSYRNLPQSTHSPFWSVSKHLCKHLYLNIQVGMQVSYNKEI